MTLHLVYEKEAVPSTRIRLREMVPYLERRGVRSRVHAYPRGAAARRALAGQLASGDAVLIHRARPTRAEVRWWRERRLPLLYDFDDAVMLTRRSGALALPRRLARAAGFRRALEMCDGVVCGSHALARRAAGSAAPRLVLPSPVRVDVPRARERAPNARPRVGWVGRAGNLRYLRGAADALRELASRRSFDLCVICDAPFSLEGCSTRWIPWTLEGEAREVARLDVGIMPLARDAWSRGKCGYKLLQYMAAGVPAVGSDVGANPELIEHARDGFLVRDREAWVDVLTRLLDDPLLRRRVGDAGRERAVARYSYDVQADRLVSFVEAVAASGRNRAR